MRTRKSILSLLLAIGIGFMACSMAMAENPNAKSEKAKLRVGTFDSRAVTIAYVGSEEHNSIIKKMMTERDKAKAEGNDKRVKELEATGKAMQEKAHLQGFGTASVSDILEKIKDTIPAIAQEAGVDIIVSKWDITYQAPNAEFVDVTDLIVKPFKPNEKTLNVIQEIKKHQPVPLEELKNMKD